MVSRTDNRELILKAINSNSRDYLWSGKSVATWQIYSYPDTDDRASHGERITYYKQILDGTLPLSDPDNTSLDDIASLMSVTGITPDLSVYRDAFYIKIGSTYSNPYKIMTEIAGRPYAGTLSYLGRYVPIPNDIDFGYPSGSMVGINTSNTLYIPPGKTDAELAALGIYRSTALKSLYANGLIEIDGNISQNDYIPAHIIKTGTLDFGGSGGTVQLDLLQYPGATPVRVTHTGLTGVKFDRYYSSDPSTTWESNRYTIDVSSYIGWKIKAVYGYVGWPREQTIQLPCPSLGRAYDATEQKSIFFPSGNLSPTTRPGVPTVDGESYLPTYVWLGNLLD